MKKMKKILAGLTVLTMLFSMTACGTSKEESNPSESEVVTEEVTTTQSAIKTYKGEVNEDTIKPSTEKNTETEDSTESSSETETTTKPAPVKAGDFSEAEAIALADEAYQSLIALDWEKAVELINYDDMIYITTRQKMDNKQLAEEMKKASDEGTLDVADMNQYAEIGGGVSFSKAERLSQNDLDELNDFVKQIGEQSGVSDFVLEDGYKVLITYENPEAIEGITLTDEPYMLVLESDGKWKFDTFIFMLKAFTDMFGMNTLGEG